MKIKRESVSTIRLPSATRAALAQITEVTGETMQRALERAVEERRRRVYLRGLAGDYAALRRDRKSSREFDAESAAWDLTDADGLGDL